MSLRPRRAIDEDTTMLEFQVDNRRIQETENWISRIAAVVWRRKILAVFAFAVGASIAVVIVAAVKPSYDATATIMVGPVLAGRAQEPLQEARTNESLARLAQSEAVVRDAIQRVGLDVLLPHTETIPAVLRDRQQLRSAFEWSRSTLKRFLLWENLLQSNSDAATPLDRAVPAIIKGLTITADRNSNIIQVRFRNKDPEVAAIFANAMAAAFIDRQLHVFNKDKTAKFFDQQAEAFNERIKQSSEALQEFGAANGIYAIGQQKELLVKRESELSAALFSTRVSLADKRGEAKKLAAELHALKPVASSSFVSSVVDDVAPRAPDDATAPRQLTVVSDPPLLMVRVYQDSMTQLFKLGSEIAGLSDRETETERQLEALRHELASLTSKEAEYARLERAVAQAKLNADTYIARAIDEQVNAKLSDAKISMLKVLESASPPQKPNRPVYFVAAFVAAVGTFFSVLAAATAQLLRSHAAARLSHQPKIAVDEMDRDEEMAARGFGDPEEAYFS